MWFLTASRRICLHAQGHGSRIEHQLGNEHLTRHAYRRLACSLPVDLAPRKLQSAGSSGRTDASLTSVQMSAFNAATRLRCCSRFASARAGVAERVPKPRIERLTLHRQTTDHALVLAGYRFLVVRRHCHVGHQVADFDH